MPRKNLKVATYISVATQEQTNSSYSLEVQRETLRKYAEMNNLEIVKEFSDTGSSLKSSKKGFSEMLKFLEGSTDCKTILVAKPDRLCRDVETLNKLQDKYTVISAEFGANNMMNQLEITFAEMYTKHLSEQIKASMKNKTEQFIENCITSENKKGEEK